MKARILYITKLIEDELRNGTARFVRYWDGWRFSFDCGGDWGEIQLKENGNVSYTINNKKGSFKRPAMVALAEKESKIREQMEDEIKSLVSQYGAARLRRSSLKDTI